MATKKHSFIAKAIKHPGALTKKADAAGETPEAFAAKHKHDSGKTGDEARFLINVLEPATKDETGNATKKKMSAADMAHAPTT